MAKSPLSDRTPVRKMLPTEPSMARLVKSFRAKSEWSSRARGRRR